MKTLTKDAVLQVTQDLMEEKDTATTLEVKTELRSQGYWAVQTDVSSHMANLALEQDWNAQNVGDHNEYSESSYQPLSGGYTPPASVSTTRKTSSTPITGPVGQCYVSSDMYRMYDGREIKTTNMPSSNDWKVTTTENNSELSFGGSYTRDEVRQAFSSINDIQFHTTRSERL